jgi:hypothetical protein
VTVEDFGNRINVYTTPALMAAKDRANELATAIDGLQSKTINITTVFHNEGSPGMPGSGGGGNHFGADFIVPPGFPNDSFPMRVESGERVQVTPANQTSTTNNTNTFNYHGVQADMEMGYQRALAGAF